MLTALREVLQDASNEYFPAAEMRRVMAQRGKSLEFSEEEVEDLADMGMNDRRIFALLAMLSPFIDFQHHHFHIDHVFPKSRFTPRRLHEAGIDENQIDILIDCANRIGNLQLLDGAINLEKQATLPAEWIEVQFPNEEKRRHYCDLYLLGEIPRDITGFLDFYEARQKRLQVRISELVNSV